MNTGQYPSSSELSTLIKKVGGISLEANASALRETEQWVELPSRAAGFVCSKNAPAEAVEELKAFLVAVYDVNDVLESSQSADVDLEDMERLAMLDPLTELPNRRKLFEFLHGILPNNSQSAILQIDLDRFKQINDSLGHAAGDEVLIVVANRLTSSVRPRDLVTRIGGDEFVVACPEINNEYAMEELAERLIESLNQPMQLQGSQYQIGASIGVAFKNAGEDIDADTWLQNADLALYTSKEKGRNRYHLYKTQMRERFDNAQSMKQELSKACENGSIIAHFQPTICVESGNISSIQAMARWQHSKLGVMSFSAFSKHADEHVLRMIDREMLRQSLLGIRHLSESDSNVSKFSVAAPMARIREPVSIDFIQAETKRHGLSECQVSLEIIEDGRPVEDDDVLLKNIAVLRDAGYGISLTNLGGQQSNMQTMLQLKPDSLKLDSSLCSNLHEDQLKQSVVRSLVGMAKNIDATIIATAVETTEDRDLLVELGCTLIQGHVIHPPASIDALATWLKTQGDNVGTKAA